MDTHSKHWEEGKSAKLAGEPYTADPYQAGTQASADWLAGFTYDEAQQNVNRAEPSEG